LYHSELIYSGSKSSRADFLGPDESELNFAVSANLQLFYPCVHTSLVSALLEHLHRKYVALSPEILDEVQQSYAVDPLEEKDCCDPGKMNSFLEASNGRV
jgi:hypothetical protein